MAIPGEDALLVVTGATGKLGGMIVDRLLAKAPVERIAVSVRDPGKAAALAARGVRVRRGDFAEPATLPTAFEGASRLLLVSSNAAAYGGDARAQTQAAINAARDAGVDHILYTSHMGVGATSAFMPMHDHAAAETVLAASGLRWTALRNGFYAETLPMMIGDALVSGRIVAPADGPVSWTMHEDLAEAAVTLLLADDLPEGPTAPLTATSAHDLADCARLLGDLTGKRIERVTIGEDELAATMAAGQAPQAVIDITTGLYRAAAAGEFATVDPTLGDLIARAPTPLGDVLRRLYVDRGQPT